MAMQWGVCQHVDHGICRWPDGMDRMDPLATLIVSLGALIVLDLAALQLGGSRRHRTRRGARPR